MEEIWKRSVDCISIKILVVILCHSFRLPRWLSGKESTSKQEMRVQFLGQEDPLEKEIATHFILSPLFLAFKWLPSHPGKGNSNPLQYSCLGNPIHRGAWHATVHEVTKSQTWLGNWTTTINHRYAIYYHWGNGVKTTWVLPVFFLIITCEYRINSKA